MTTMSRAPAEKAPTSDRRITIKLSGGRYQGTFRPPNFDELVQVYGMANGPQQMEKLHDITALDDGNVPPLAKRSFAIQVLKLAGDDLTAVEAAEDDITDDAAAEALVERKEKMPHASFVFLRIDDDPVLAFLEPKSGVLEGSIAKKGKGAPALPIDLSLIDNHCAAGREQIDVYKREQPLAIVALAAKLYEIGGATLEAELEKA